MKTNMIVKLGISMLVMLMTIGTVSASGGPDYAGAQSIYVPAGTYDIWSGSFTSDDWYRFAASNGDMVHVDLQLRFLQNGGELKLHDNYQGDIQAWVSSSHSDHEAYNLQANPEPRIEIVAGSQFNYQFLAGRNV